MICKNCGLDTDPGPACSHCGAALSPANEGGDALSPSSVPSTNNASAAKRKLPVPGVVPRSGGKSQVSGYVPIPRESVPGSASANVPIVAAATATEGTEQASGASHIEEILPIKEVIPATIQHAEPTVVSEPATAATQEAESRGTMFPPVSPATATATPPTHNAPRKRVHVDDLEIDEVKVHRSPAVGLAMYVGAIVPILLLLAAVSHFLPAVYVVAWIAAQFAGGLLLPLLRVTPFSDEDSDDIALAVVLTFLFGPAAGLAIYLLIGLLKQNVNPSIAGCLLVATLCRITVDAARPQNGAFNIVHNLMYTMPFTPIHNAEHLALGWTLIRTLLLDWMSLVTLLGWISAVMFRKLDE